MKHLFISFFLLGSLSSVYAQNDSLSKPPVISDSTSVTNNTMNNVKNDSTGSVNNSMKSDSTAIMNNTMKSDSTGSVNNNSTINSTNTQNNVNSSATNASQVNSSNVNTNPNAGMSNTSSVAIVNIQNIQGQPGYASLPILESYVPADVVDKVKSKYNYVYDITPIKHTADQTAFVVRHLDNGVYKTEIIGVDGNVVQ